MNVKVNCPYDDCLSVVSVHPIDFNLYRLSMRVCPECDRNFTWKAIDVVTVTGKILWGNKGEVETGRSYENG